MLQRHSMRRLRPWRSWPKSWRLMTTRSMFAGSASVKDELWKLAGANPERTRFQRTLTSAASSLIISSFALYASPPRSVARSPTCNSAVGALTSSLATSKTSRSATKVSASRLRKILKTRRSGTVASRSASCSAHPGRIAHLQSPFRMCLPLPRLAYPKPVIWHPCLFQTLLRSAWAAVCRWLLRCSHHHLLLTRVPRLRLRQVPRPALRGPIAISTLDGLAPTLAQQEPSLTTTLIRIGLPRRPVGHGQATKQEMSRIMPLAIRHAH